MAAEHASVVSAFEQMHLLRPAQGRNRISDVIHVHGVPYTVLEAHGWRWHAVASRGNFKIEINLFWGGLGHEGMGEDAGRVVVTSSDITETGVFSSLRWPQRVDVPDESSLGECFSALVAGAFLSPATAHGHASFRLVDLLLLDPSEMRTRLVDVW